MSRVQRNKKYKKNWKETNKDITREKRIKNPQSTNRRDEVKKYMREFGGFNEE